MLADGQDAALDDLCADDVLLKDTGPAHRAVGVHAEDVAVVDEVVGVAHHADFFADRWKAWREVEADAAACGARAGLGEETVVFEFDDALQLSLAQRWNRWQRWLDVHRTVACARGRFLRQPIEAAVTVVDARRVAKDPGDDVVGGAKAGLFDARRAIENSDVLALVGDEHHAAAGCGLPEDALDFMAPALGAAACVDSNEVTNTTCAAGRADRERHVDVGTVAIGADVGQIWEVLFPEHAARREVEGNDALTL